MGGREGKRGGDERRGEKRNTVKGRKMKNRYTLSDRQGKRQEWRVKNSEKERERNKETDRE